MFTTHPEEGKVMQKSLLVLAMILMVLGVTIVGHPEYALAQPVTAAKAAAASKLYEAAKKEGEVVLWGPPTDTVEKYYPQEFQRVFPGITVKPVGDIEAPQKLLTEALAGRHQADVLWWSISGFLDLHKRGLVGRFESDTLEAFGIAPDDTTLDDRGLKVANVIYTVAYDTRRLKPQELPKTWEDLLDPRWRGQIVGATLLMPGVPATLGLVKGEQSAMDFARALRDTAKVTMVPGSPVAREMLHRGEKDLMIYLISEVLKRKLHYNDPVDWAPVSPAWSTQHILGVLQKGPHPNAAKLFSLWAASKEGKVAIERVSFDGDAHPGAPTQLAKLIQEAGLKILFEDIQNTGSRIALYRKARAILLGETK
jgi:iron(III) transport system substrate-binding protein